MRANPDLLSSTARVHDGVLTTAQLLGLGLDPTWVRRQVDAGRWQRLHRGVLYTYSGPVPWRSRALAAVRYAGPGAALSHDAAARLLGMTGREPEVVDVSIPASRRVRPTEGVRIHTRASMPATRGWLPAVVAPETTVDLVAQARTVDDAVSWICAAVRTGVPPAAIAAAARRRSRVPRRALLDELIADVADGVESPLERRYHHDVERRHALPRAVLQVRRRVDGRWTRADRRYERFAVSIELDGWLGHPGGRTDADAWRDNAVLLERGDLTLRYRWRHVLVTPCACARQVASALRRGGWRGSPQPCGPTCTAT